MGTGTVTFAGYNIITAAQGEYDFTPGLIQPVWLFERPARAVGDLSKYTIRDVQGTTRIQRFDDSAFALANQVGFCGWTRSGGNLLDTAAVRLYVNSAT